MYNDLNVTEWDEFYVHELFLVRRGERIVKEEYVDNGKYGVVTAKTTDNGIDGAYDYSNTSCNCITICGEVNGMKSFYQKNKVWALDTVRICEPLFELNEDIAMFLIPILEKNMSKYSYSRKVKTENLLNTVIKLPVKIDKPDWDFMEKYILLKKEENIINPKFLSMKKNINAIDFINAETWTEFKIIDIFDIYRGKRLTEDDRITGNLKYFSASETNNGFTDKISNPLFVDNNKIIYSTFGDAFYVGEKFTASDEILILDINKIYNVELNPYIGMFLITVLNKMKIKFMFGRKAFLNKVENEIIKLPTRNNIPDWEYMESYIKGLNFSSKIDYNR